MSKEECLPCVKERVDALITNSVTAYKETDRDWMQKLTADQLDLMKPVETVKEVTPEMAVNVLKPTFKSTEDVIAVLPDGDIKEQFNAALKVYADEKESLISAIIANTEKDLWEKDELATKKIGELRKIYKTAKVNTNAASSDEDGGEYSGIIAGNYFMVNTTSDDNEPVMLPRGIDFK
jgi:DNA-directed RNA polymerase